MDGGTNSFMSSRFGTDFSDVKIHTDTKAAKMNQEISARAFTVRNDVYFDKGEYRPSSLEGQRLLAHELTHVVQQRKNKNNAQIQRKCAAANLKEKMTGCIQPISIAKDNGKGKTKIPSMHKVKSIWNKCCIKYKINSTKVVKKTNYQTLDESVNNTPTAEQNALFAAAGASSCIQVFVPKTFHQGVKTSKSISGGGATYDAGNANAKIVVVEGAKSAVVAHEVGHATGYLGHDAKSTVMKPTGAYNKANKSKVSTDVCTKARTGAILTKKAKKNCCLK